MGPADGSDLRPLPASLGKIEAVRILSTHAGLRGEAADIDQVADTIVEIGRALGRLSNQHVDLVDCAQISGASLRLAYGEHVRELPKATHLSGVPDCFTEASHIAHSPNLRVLEMADGYICHYRDGPLVVSADGEFVAQDFSSPFAGLVHYYETPLRQVLADAVRIEGTVVALADDVRPINFCHWLVDWLPRMTCMGERRLPTDTFVVVPPLHAAYQWELLRLAGVSEERVIQLHPMQAAWARRLLAPSDVRTLPHPGHKAAPWLTDYIRGTLGFGALLENNHGSPVRRKYYVSRGDAAGRRVVNEAALIASLVPLGYQAVTLVEMPMTQQIATFAFASHIVGPHGAGLANIVFAHRTTTLVEIFPSTYGTAAYYVLAAGLGMTYASYISTSVLPASRTQLDDMYIDIADFLARCRHLL